MAIPGAWEGLRKLLSKAFERDEETVFADLRDGYYRAFRIAGEIDGVIIVAESGNDLRINYAGGRISPPRATNVAIMLGAIERAARKAGRQGIVITGRVGWSRYLSPLGYARVEDDGPHPQFRKAL